SATRNNGDHINLDEVLGIGEPRDLKGGSGDRATDVAPAHLREAGLVACHVDVVGRETDHVVEVRTERLEASLDVLPELFRLRLDATRREGPFRSRVPDLPVLSG